MTLFGGAYARHEENDSAFAGRRDVYGRPGVGQGPLG